MNNKKEQLLDITISRLDEKYPPGLYEFLYINDIRAYSRILKLEDSINVNFTKNGTIEDLKAILRQYWVEHMNAILEYKKTDPIKESLDEVRIKRIESMEMDHQPNEQVPHSFGDM